MARTLRTVKVSLQTPDESSRQSSPVVKPRQPKQCMKCIRGQEDAARGSATYSQTLSQVTCWGSQICYISGVPQRRNDTNCDNTWHICMQYMHAMHSCCACNECTGLSQVPCSDGQTGLNHNTAPCKQSV